MRLHGRRLANNVSVSRLPDWRPRQSVAVKHQNKSPMPWVLVGLQLAREKVDGGRRCHNTRALIDDSSACTIAQDSEPFFSFFLPSYFGIALAT